MLAASTHASPKPLYRWPKDQKPGGTTGDGFKNLWHVGSP
jgi:predicted lipoprotein with Yx(FWY)xxD motif